MVLGKFPVPGVLQLDVGRARAYFACSRCRLGLEWTFLLSSVFSMQQALA